MAELKVSTLDDHVARVPHARAERKGISFEEEVRRTLAASVRAGREALIWRAEALRKDAGNQPGRAEFDGARLIREERDARR